MSTALFGPLCHNASMNIFHEDMQIVELELFDAAFAVSPDDEDDVRRRFMTLIAAPSSRQRGGSSEILRVTNVMGERFALKRLRVSHAEKDDAPVPAMPSHRKELRRTIDGSSSPTPATTPDYVTQGHVAAFWEEYRVHLALSHLRGFPRLYGFGLCQGNPLIVMELVEGITLRAALRAYEGELPLESVACLGLAIARILLRAGELDEGFVHRDLSPRNVMLRTDKTDAQRQLSTGAYDLCLVDLGSATLDLSGLADPSFTQDSDVWRMGTPAYAPPEMLSSDVALPEGYRHSPKIDVYALCSMLYELYAGEPPFGRLWDDGSLSPYRVKTEGRPAALVPRDPDGGILAETIMAGLEARQEDRPTMAQLDAALHNWLQLPGQRVAGARKQPGRLDVGFWQPDYARRLVTRRAFVTAGLVGVSAMASCVLVGGRLLREREPVLDESRYALAAGPYEGEPLFKAYDADSNGWVLCTADGGIVARPESSRECGALREGLVVLFDDASERYGYVAPSAEKPELAWAILPTFALATDMSEGLAAAQDPRSKLWGYVDATGAWAIPARYASAMPFSQGTAAVRQADETLWGAIDVSGAWLVEPRFATLGMRDEGGYAVAEDAERPGSWGVVDATGEWTDDARFFALRRLCDGLAPARATRDGKWGYVDAAGAWVIEPAFMDARPFFEGQAAVQDVRTQLWYFVGRDGKPTRDMAPTFGKLGDLHDGLAPAQASASDDVVVFDDGSKATGLGMRYGYVDAAGSWQMRRLTHLLDVAIGSPDV